MIRERSSTPPKLWTVLWVLAVVVPMSQQTSPGLKLRLSQPGLNYAAQVAVDQMTKDVQGQTIPDQHGSDHVAIGKINYDLTGMSVTSFGRPTSSVVVKPGTGVTWSLCAISASVHGDWRYKYRKAFIKISDHGSFDVSVSDASISVTIGMGVDATGRPTISSKSCSSDAGHIKVKFHGGASWLYNLFDHVLEKPLKKRLQDILCSAANKAINVKAANQLKKMKIQVPIEGLALLDYRLVAAPVFGSPFIETLHKGEFFLNGDPTEAPFQPAPLPEPPTTDRMVSIWLSEYVLNTLGYMVEHHGFLQYTLTNKDLSPKTASALNVTCSTGLCIGGFLPQLKAHFPNGIVELAMKATERPTLHIQTSGITGMFKGEIKYNVRLPDGTVKYAFTTEMFAEMILNIAMENHKITANIKTMNTNVTVTNSSIGDVNEKGLQFLFNIISNQFIIPKLNAKGKEGVELPMINDVTFVNPQLHQLQGALCLQTDVKYTPGDNTLFFHSQL